MDHHVHESDCDVSSQNGLKTDYQESLKDVLTPIYQRESEINV